MTTPHDAVVIGSGLGGLACAARLARSGARVLVVERHDQLGGYASAFGRGVFDFEISLHLMDAVGLGEPHRQVLDELGVGDALTLCKPAVLRHEHWPDRELVVPHGMGAFEEVMATHFPAERAGLAALACRAAARARGVLSGRGRRRLVAGRRDAEHAVPARRAGARLGGRGDRRARR